MVLVDGRFPFGVGGAIGRGSLEKQGVSRDRGVVEPDWLGVGHTACVLCPVWLFSCWGLAASVA